MMSRNADVIKMADQYIKENNLDISAEELFIKFNEITILHREFEAYLSNSKLIQKLNRMQRNERLLQKRKLFTQWYLQLNQNTKQIKEITYELSEMVFSSTRTVEKDLSSEATE